MFAIAGVAVGGGADATDETGAGVDIAAAEERKFKHIAAQRDDVTAEGSRLSSRPR